MEWIVDNGVIQGRDNSRVIIPTVNEIFNSTDVIGVSGEEYPFALNGIKISRLIGLPVSLHLEYVDGKISCLLLAVKQGVEYPIATYEGRLLGYSIIGERWYYLDSEYEVIRDVFAKLDIPVAETLEYFQYIRLTNELKNLQITIHDNVAEKVDQVKNSVCETKAISLNDIFFPYQKAGVKWLEFMSSGNCGCILGDEMGLGKTLQIIGLMESRKRENADTIFLIAAPISLLVNWQREIEKFCPTLSTYIHHGQNRTGFYKDLLQYDVIITSYGSVQSDSSMLAMIQWDILVVDEAQGIKNPYSKRRRFLNEIKRRMTIAVTGTPFENHITDIWSLSDFVLPGYMGTLGEFNAKYEDDVFSAEEIEKSLSPIMIRRKVSDVADDLPEKIEIAQPIIMSEQEAEYYENERNTMEGKAALNQIRIELIQGLRVFCTHPQAYRDDLVGVDPAKISNKYRRTCELLEEIISYGEKAIIFTSFTKMINIFCEDITSRFGIETLYINGSVSASERQAVIDRFSQIVGPAVLVLNPRAAGAGLNITCANHVIHYNLEWNPAIESQASARAYRRGQTKTVFIYRLFYEGTIEEFVNSKIESKQEIFNNVVIGNEGTINSSDLAKALSYSPRREMFK